MAYIDTIPVQEASGAVRTMYETAQQDWGYVPDYARAFCHRPEVMACWNQLLSAITGPVDERRLELATFAAAHALGNTPCSVAHGKKLAGIIGQEAVIALSDGADSADLTDAERAIVRFARQVARDASRVSRNDVQALKDEHGLTDAEVFDIAAIAAGRAFFTKMLDALGVDADSPMGQMPDELSRALVVGRPIGTAPPEAL